MNDNNSASQRATLQFKDHPVRIVMIDGVPYFSLEDICEAAGWSLSVCDRLHSKLYSFPDHTKRPCYEETEDGLRDTTVLSPVGVWRFTVSVDSYRGAGVAAWAKRESFRLCPNPRPKDPAMFLTLGKGGELPIKPTKYSGRRSEWFDLRDSEEYRKGRLGNLALQLYID